MTDPLERTARAVHSLGVSVAQLLGMHEGVDLRWLPGDKDWYCERVAPVVWFDEALLGVSTNPDLTPWLVVGDKITLTAANGTWIWIKTGRQKRTPEEILPQTLHEARWPD